MPGRRSHGRRSALNGVVHQGRGDADEGKTMCHLQRCQVCSPEGSGMSREVHVPFYERLGVQFPRPTHRFSLSFWDVEALLAERGITVTYETIRQGCRTFGLEYAQRRRRGRQRDTWYLDELFVRMQGRTQYLWRPGGHRHTTPRPGCTPSGPAVRRPAHGPIRAPSCRSLSPAHTAPRATPAPVQLSRSGTTILVRAWTRPHPFPRWPSPGASGAPAGTTKTLFSHWGCRHDRRLTRAAITIPSTGALDERSLDSTSLTVFLERLQYYSNIYAKTASGRHVERRRSSYHQPERSDPADCTQS